MADERDRFKSLTKPRLDYGSPSFGGGSAPLEDSVLHKCTEGLLQTRDTVNERKIDEPDAGRNRQPTVGNDNDVPVSEQTDGCIQFRIENAPFFHFTISGNTSLIIGYDVCVPRLCTANAPTRTASVTESLRDAP